MKKLLTVAFSLLALCQLNAQTVVYSEGFEGVSPAVTATPALSWDVTTTVASNGNRSDTSTVVLNDTTFLTTNTFSTVGNTFITLEFDHICLIEFFDEAILQVSTNGGSSWTTVTNSNSIYQSVPPGSSGWVGTGKWNFTSYGNWSSAPTHSNALWQHEWFDVSGLLSNQANCQVRFMLSDQNGNGPGTAQYTGWFIDSIVVTAAPCELVPPTMVQVADPVIFSGNVYYTGPYNISAKINDASGLDTVAIKWTVNGGPQQFAFMTPWSPGSDTFRATIPALTIGDTVCYSICAQDSSPCGNWNYLPGPGATNCIGYKVFKTAPASCQGTPVQVLTSHLETFDTWTAGNGTTGNPGTFVPDWYKPTNYGQPAFSWFVHTGSSPQWTTTGAPGDHTGGGNYLYMESSYTNPFAFDTVIIVSPCFDIDSISNPALEFWYMANTRYLSYSEIRLDVHNGLVWVNDVDTIINHHDDQNWLRREVDLSAFGGIIQFRFRGIEVSSTSWGDVCIDDFYIYDKQPWDAAATQIVNPGYFAPIGLQDSVIVRMFNYGFNTITNMNVSYSINGGAPVTEAYSGTFPTNTFQNYKFNTKYTVPSGPYSICAWVSLANDADFTNDTTCFNATGLPTDTTTYASNFDNDTIWVSVPGTLDKWELGMPNFGATNSTYSGINAWDVNLNTGTNAAQKTYLYTQYYDLTNANNSRMIFHHNYNTYPFGDGMYIEYSTNGGQTWLRLGNQGDPLGVNWYNYTAVGTSPNFNHGWVGNSGGWVTSEYDCSAFDGTPNIQFRFVYEGESVIGATPREGYSVDNFQLIDPLADDVQMVAIENPAKNGCLLSNNENITVRVRNLGTNTATNIPVYFEFNGVTYGPDTVPGPLATYQDTTYTFNQQVDMSNLGCYALRAWTAYSPDRDLSNDTLPVDSFCHFSGCELTIEYRTGSNFTSSTSYWWELRDQSNAVIKRQPLGGLPINSTFIDKVCVLDGMTYTFQMQANSTFHPFIKVSAYDSTYYQSSGAYTSVLAPIKCPPLLTATTDDVQKAAPSPLPLPQLYDIRSTVRCDGLTDIDTLLIYCDINGLPFDQDTIVMGAPLTYGQTILHTFGQKWAAPAGCHNIKVWTDQPNFGVDMVPATDTSYLSICIFDSTTIQQSGSYCNNFETSQAPWVALNALNHKSSTGWASGTPNQTIINAAFSGANAWMTRLDTNYHILDSSAVYTPMFVVDSGRCYKVEFEHKFESEMQQDGGHVEYSTDKGNTWKLLGHLGDTLGTDWYNVPNVVGINAPPFLDGFSGSSSSMPNTNGWVHSEYKLVLPLPSSLVLRFRWTSDASSTFDSEGWAIDDFCFTEIGPCKVNTTGIDNNQVPGLTLGQNVPNPANDLTTINFTIPNSAEVKFAVTNALGEVIYNEMNTRTAGAHKIDLDVKNWAGGVYYYYIEYDNNVLARKMIIAK